MSVLLLRRVKAHRTFDVGDAFVWFSRIDVHQASSKVRVPVIWIERQGPVSLVAPSLVILLPQAEQGSDIMHERILVVFGDRLGDKTVGLVQ